MIAFLGSLHPAVVHFPIALVVTTVLAEAALSRSRNPAFGTAARFMITVAALFAAPAAALGFAAAAGEPVETEVAAALGVHRILGVASAVLTALAAGLAYASARNQERWRGGLYRAVLGVTLLAILATAHFGAIVTHGPSYLSWR